MALFLPDGGHEQPGAPRPHGVSVAGSARMDGGLTCPNQGGDVGLFGGALVIEGLDGCFTALVVVAEMVLDERLVLMAITLLTSMIAAGEGANLVVEIHIAQRLWQLVNVGAFLKLFADVFSFRLAQGFHVQRRIGMVCW